MKIVIITDGNNKLGMGHIYQSMTLAGLLSTKTNGSAKILFMTKSDQRVIKILERTGKPVCRYADDDSIFKALVIEEPDNVIFDKLDVSSDLAKRIKTELKSKLIIFTNLTKANDFADVTILADIGSNFKNICQQEKDTGKVHFWGPKYWLLRSEFYEYKKLDKNKSLTTENIMIMFGGSDSCNFSSSVLYELLKMDTGFNIKLVLGATFDHRNELSSVIEKNKRTKSRFQILESVDNIAELMYNSDLVFVSPGLSFFEALAVGTPVIGFHQNDLQRDVYKDYLKTYGLNDIKKISHLLNERYFIYPEDTFIKSMEIGEGLNEILDVILN